jgi:hypothetical protein
LRERACALRARELCALGVLLIAGCTTNVVGAVPTPVPISVAQTSKLQLAVGTANIGAQNNQQVTGLNVVATFRQSNGNNATGLNDPQLTGPPGINLSGLQCAPAPLNYPALALAAAPRNVFSGVTIPQLQSALAASATPAPTVPAGVGQFGPQIGVFGYGLGGYNSIPQTDLRSTSPAVLNPGAGISPCLTSNLPFTSHVNSAVLGGGTALNSEELALPIGSGGFPGSAVDRASGTVVLSALGYTSSANQQLPIATYGGPPGWPSPQGYGNFSYFDGYPEGFTDFGVTPVSGTYQLSATYPTSADYSQSATVTASARLPSAGAVLPAMPQTALTINPDGSGFVSLDVPPGVTETIVNVSSQDCDPIDRPLGPTNHYSIVTKKSGPQQLFFSANLGPPNAAGVATHTFCTVGDLQAYDAYLNSGGQATLPNLTFVVYVQAVGFDYPAYEASYPFSTTEAPTIVGPSGTADITTSYPVQTDYEISLPGSSS